MNIHRVRQTLSPCTWGTQVSLKCTCGNWSAMTVSYGPYTVRSCVRSLLSGADGIHNMSALVK